MRGSGALRTGVAPGGALAGPWTRDELWRRARAVPSLDLRFAENKSLVDATTGANLVTFTRASSGTYVDSTGTICTAVTNLLLRSEEFDNASWSKTNANVTANAVAAPNGTLTADVLIEDTANGLHRTFNGWTAIAGTPYVASFYVKAAGRTKVDAELRATSTVGSFTFDLLAGTVSGTVANQTASIANVGNGWFRCSVAVSGAGVTAGASLILIYLNNGTFNSYTGDGTSGIYLWGAQLEQSSTVGEYIPTTSTINSAPRFDHNPTTGESLGLLVEEARTNSIRNNTMVGAVAGTPGTLPTNWVFVAGTTGIASEVVGTGTANGINYIDIRYSGTAAATSSFSQRFEGAAVAAALTGQTWALSTWTKVQAGTTTGITAINHQYVENTSGGSFVTSGTVALTVDSTFTRHTSSRTLSGGATVAFVTGGISVVVTSGQAIDITLRIGLPQLEQGAFATSVIPTSTAAATRSADVASISGSNFSGWYRQDEGTVFADYNIYAPSGSYSAAEISDGTSNNRMILFHTAAGSARYLTFFSGSAVVTTLDRTAVAASKWTGAYKAGDYGSTYNANAALTNTYNGTISGSQIRIGSSVTGSNFAGTIRRLTYWPARLPNNVLQTLTQ